MSLADPREDPYVAYLHRFFARWSPVYDLFAAPIAFAYRAAVRAAGAAPRQSVDSPTVRASPYLPRLL